MQLCLGDRGAENAPFDFNSSSCFPADTVSVDPTGVVEVSWGTIYLASQSIMRVCLYFSSAYINIYCESEYTLTALQSSCKEAFPTDGLGLT